MTTRTEARVQFLADVLVKAIENDGYGAFTTEEYEIDTDIDGDPHAFAVIRFIDQVDGEPSHRVTIDTLAHGIQVISDAELKPLEAGDTVGVLHNATTGDRMFMSQVQRKAILDASRYNDAGEIDVIDALAILECSIFGKVVYA